MSINGYQRLLVLLLAVVVVLLACIFRLGWVHNLERLDAKGTWTTLMDLEACQKAVADMTVNEAANILDYVTLPRARPGNPHLNMIIDRERTRAVQEIIRALRNKTGENLGDDPKVWIQKHAASNPKKQG